MGKLNLELKYLCNDFSPIRKILKDLRARKIGTFNQKDYFFNLPISKDQKIIPRLKLRIQENEYTLVYYERGDFSDTSATPAKVTLFKVSDKKLLDFLKKVLGIKIVVIKKRDLWKKDRAVFNLDTVRNVGKIFEIEIATDGGLKDRELFNHYKNKFLPYLNHVVKRSNLDLVLGQTHSNNLDH